MNIEEVTEMVMESMREVNGTHPPTFYIQTSLGMVALVVAFDSEGPGTFQELIVSAAKQMAVDNYVIQSVAYASTVMTSPATEQPDDVGHYAGVEALLIEAQDLMPGSPRIRRFWFVDRAADGVYLGTTHDPAVRAVANDDNPLTIFLVAFAAFVMGKVD